MSHMAPITSSDRADVRKQPLFSSLTDTQWNALQSAMHYEHFEPNTQILSSTDTSTDLYWIESGEVHAQRTTPFGEQSVGQLKAHDVFGEIALIDGKGHAADVFTQTSTRLWRLDGRQLKALFEQDASLACLFYKFFWRSLSEKIHLANELLKNFFAGELEEPSELTETPSRPAWFAPPEGADSSPSNELAASPFLKIPAHEKRQKLHKQGLSEQEIDLLFELGEELYIPEEEAIFHEGDFGDTLFFILYGDVRISKELPGVGPEALAILEAGQIFGEMSLVSENAKRSADCFAHEQPVLLLAFRLHVLNALQEKIDVHYSFLQAICKMMSHRLREINDKLVSWKMMRGGFF